MSSSAESNVRIEVGICEWNIDSVEFDGGWETLLSRVETTRPVEVGFERMTCWAWTEKWVGELCRLSREVPLEEPRARTHCKSALFDCFTKVAPLLATWELPEMQMCSNHRFAETLGLVAKLDDKELLPFALRSFGITQKTQLLKLIEVVCDFNVAVFPLLKYLLELIAELHPTSDEQQIIALSLLPIEQGNMLRFMKDMGYEIHDAVIMMDKAVEKNWTEALKVVLKIFPVDIDDENMHALRRACRLRHEEIAEILILNGASIPLRNVMIRRRSDIPSWKTLGRVLARMALKKRNALQRVFLCRTAISDQFADLVVAFAVGENLVPGSDDSGEICKEVRRLWSIADASNAPFKRQRL